MGKKRNGKDTFAARLMSHHAFTRLAFADPIRDALALDPRLPIEHDEFGALFAPAARYDDAEDISASVTSSTRRLGRAKGPARAAGSSRTSASASATTSTRRVGRRTLREADKIPGPVVITDVRFPNEVGGHPELAHPGTDRPRPPPRPPGDRPPHLRDRAR